MTREKRAAYHQKTRIRFDTIRMKDTKGENPSALPVFTIVIVCIMYPTQGPSTIPSNKHQSERSSKGLTKVCSDFNRS